MTKPKLPLFNIALRPVHLSLAAKVVSAAKPYKPSASDYLLGPRALPHVTLCFFRATDAQTASQALRSWSAPKVFSLTLGPAVHIADPAGIPGVSWAQIKITPEPDLMDLQQNCRDHLERLGLEPLTRAETYDPHFTLARLKGSVTAPDGSPNNLEEGRVVLCRPDVGRSTETGVFLHSVAFPGELRIRTCTPVLS